MTGREYVLFLISKEQQIAASLLPARGRLLLAGKVVGRPETTRRLPCLLLPEKEGAGRQQEDEVNERCLVCLVVLQNGQQRRTLKEDCHRCQHRPRRRCHWMRSDV
jgi:hypothetical protein